MAVIRPSADLRNNYSEISKICHQTKQPIYITKNGYNDLVLLSNEAYEDLVKGHLTEEEIERLYHNLKKFSLDITGTNSFDKAQVCSGGVPLTEINTKTMESLKVSDLYITGELLDVDGLCGGYNLTFSWITGILAGGCAAND